MLLPVPTRRRTSYEPTIIDRLLQQDPFGSGNNHPVRIRKSILMRVPLVPAPTAADQSDVPGTVSGTTLTAADILDAIGRTRGADGKGWEIAYHPAAIAEGSAQKFPM